MWMLKIEQEFSSSTGSFKETNPYISLMLSYEKRGILALFGQLVTLDDPFLARAFALPDYFSVFRGRFYDIKEKMRDARVAYSIRSQLLSRKPLRYHELHWGKELSYD